MLIPYLFLFQNLAQPFIDWSPILENSFKLEITFVILVSIKLFLDLSKQILTLKEAHRLVKQSLKLKNKEETCSICLDSLIKIFEDVEQLSCSHNFHNSCITKWIITQKDYKTNSSCPLCRIPFKKHSKNSYQDLSTDAENSDF